ncbi:MAG: NifB/NifX family molybdenum-iron cluster-binding protein [Oligoflexia bacterium]|nr:NifB/NifX family molybdenum-iron cluster-binding protein [Oligoflexia bacterium]
MKLCLPVNESKEIDSTICAHFGSAPFFMIVDTDTLNCKAITNTNQHHSHGMCQPLAALSGEQIDGIIVGGIGGGALSKLHAQNIKVYKSNGYSSIKDVVDAYKKGLLSEMGMESACSHHHGH